MSRFSETLRTLIDARCGGEIEEVARRTGLARVTISRHLNGHASPNYSTRRLYAQAFTMRSEELEELWRAAETGAETQWRSAEEFLGGKWRMDIAPQPPRGLAGADQSSGVPILGRVTAGGMVESMAEEHDQEGRTSPYELRRIPLRFDRLHGVFALEIVGDSMTPQYEPGSFAAFVPIRIDQITDGVDVVVQLNGGHDGQSTFKRIFLTGTTKIKLTSLNAKYAPREVDICDVARVSLCIGQYRGMTTDKVAAMLDDDGYRVVKE